MNYKEVKQWLQQAQRIVILTGAGMSTESGIPDFRSAEGRWRHIDPLTVATVDAYEQNYELFHSFYAARLHALQGITPHSGYDVLTHWQQTYGAFIATQNVDGLHQLAGASQVAELHGNIRTARCGRCQQEATIHDFLGQSSCACGGMLRPNVVLFGEYLREDVWTETMHAIEQADVVFVIGTSLTVYPVNQLPTMTTGKRFYINLACDDETAANYAFDAIFIGEAGDILQRIEQCLD